MLTKLLILNFNLFIQIYQFVAATILFTGLHCDSFQPVFFADIQGQLMADSVDQPLHDVEMEVKADSIASTSVGSRKRRLSENEIAGPSKRAPTGIQFTADNIEKFNLLDFSDEVLLEILLHCNSVTLQALNK